MQVSQPLLSQPQVIAAFIVGTVALVGVAVAKWREARIERDREQMRLRRDALHAALAAVDHVIENLPFNNAAPTRPEEWDERGARDAWNKMLLYCAYPGETVRAFYDALLLREAGEPEPPERLQPIEALGRFRAQVRRELEAAARRQREDATVLARSDRLWVVRLPGSKSSRMGSGSRPPLPPG